MAKIQDPKQRFIYACHDYCSSAVQRYSGFLQRIISLIKEPNYLHDALECMKMLYMGIEKKELKQDEIIDDPVKLRELLVRVNQYHCVIEDAFNLINAVGAPAGVYAQQRFDNALQDRRVLTYISKLEDVIIEAEEAVQECCTYLTEYPDKYNFSYFNHKDYKGLNFKDSIEKLWAETDEHLAGARRQLAEHGIPEAAKAHLSALLRISTKEGGARGLGGSSKKPKP